MAKFTCGPRVAKFLLTSQGKTSWPEEPATLRAALTAPTLPSTLVKMLGAHGLKAAVMKFYSAHYGLAWLKNELETGRPLALMIRANVLNHWVVLAGIGEGIFQIYDPTFENKSMTLTEQELMKIWRAPLGLRFHAVAIH